jgi:hypothetical protein
MQFSETWQASRKEKNSTLKEEVEVKRLATAKAVDRKHTSRCAEDAKGVAQTRKPRGFVRTEAGLLE